MLKTSVMSIKEQRKTSRWEPMYHVFAKQQIRSILKVPWRPMNQPPTCRLRQKYADWLSRNRRQSSDKRRQRLPYGNPEHSQMRALFSGGQERPRSEAVKL